MYPSHEKIKITLDDCFDYFSIHCGKVDAEECSQHEKDGQQGEIEDLN